MDPSQITYLISFIIILLFFVCSLIIICLQKNQRKNSESYPLI
jgi:hypothetical protein